MKTLMVVISMFWVMINFLKCPVFCQVFYVDVLVLYGQQKALIWFGLVWFLRP